MIGRTNLRLPVDFRLVLGPLKWERGQLIWPTNFVSNTHTHTHTLSCLILNILLSIRKSLQASTAEGVERATRRPHASHKSLFLRQLEHSEEREKWMNKYRLSWHSQRNPQTGSVTPISQRSDTKLLKVRNKAHTSPSGITTTSWDLGVC